jgi:ABC-type transport system involved in multi-copper enzyme maturation permease subunit
VFKTILKREILHNVYSLRFILSLVLILAVFIAHSLSFVRSHESALDKYRESRGLAVKAMREDASKGATSLAVTQRAYDLPPRDNTFITDAKEKFLPNSLIFSAWNVFGFQNKSGSSNPFLPSYDELNWMFIAALIISFVTFLFTFDAVSGEKESRTLAQALSNSVSRGTLLFGKYLSAVLSVMLILVPGVLISLLIVLSTGAASWNGSLAGEAAAYLAAAGLLTAMMAAFGLLCSVLARNSNVSLLLALSAWILFAVVIPNSSGFLAKNLFPVEKAETVMKRSNKAREDLGRAAPPGSWMSQNNNPFLPQHELRANLQRKLLAAEKQIRDAYYLNMFRQFERTRRLISISPVAAFEYLIEAAVGGGYQRFRKVWDDLHVFQIQFQDFFTALDAKDPKSPHWLNPNEDVSTTRLPVSFETVPQFTERPMSFADRFKPALKYVLALVLMGCVVYFTSFILFVRYDVR